MFFSDVPVIVGVSNLGNELETLNPYLTLTNGDFNMNITEDGLYSLPSIPLDSAYHIYQSNDSNLASAFRCLITIITLWYLL